MNDGATVRPFQLAVPDEPPAHREHFGGSADDAHYAVAPFAQEQEPRSPVAAPYPGFPCPSASRRAAFTTSWRNGGIGPNAGSFFSRVRL
jgi:hypothetical protein